MRFSDYINESQVWKYFKKDSTGMPFYDEMIDNPDYYRERKGYDSKIVMMSPAEYMKGSAKIHKSTYTAQVDNLDPDRIAEIADKIKSGGSKMPMMVLDYARNEQEGRHRSQIARKLGLPEVPVLVVNKVEKK